MATKKTVTKEAASAPEPSPAKKSKKTEKAPLKKAKLKPVVPSSK